MLQIIGSEYENVVAVRATGLLTDQDYKLFVPELEKIIREKGPVSVLIEFENFRGWEPKAMWADFRTGLEHGDDFEKIAIVGEKAWHHLFAVIAKPFTSAEVRYFDHNEIQRAWDWILEGKKDARRGNDGQALQGGEKKAITAVISYRRIVVAVDFSPHAEKALNRAVELGALYAADIKVMHAFQSILPHEVVPDDFAGVIAAPSLYDPQLDRQLYDSAVKRLEEMVGKIDYPAVSSEVIWGSPTPAILSYAESQNADLIIAGSHGRRGIARLLGSTANGLIHSARCDVLLVRLE